MKRQPQYDVLRILACMMIVMMHSPLPGKEGDGLFLSSMSYLTAPGIGLFFMVSGALLLPVKLDTRSFLWKRFVKIALPTMLWTLLYLCCNVWMKDGNITWRNIMSVPFSAQGNPVFWFIYTLLGLYLLAPILSPWLAVANRKVIEFYLCLWAVSLCYPVLRLFVDINSSNTGILYYFSGYVGYFLLGYYLKTYPKRVSDRWLLPAMFLSLVVPIVCKWKNVEVDFYSMFWYLSLFVAIQCVFWWKACVTLSSKWFGNVKQTVLAEVSKLTFGIYLVHIFIMRYVLWKWDIVLGIQPYWLQTVFIIVLTFAGALVITYLISMLPFAKYLIGYQHGKSS